MRTKGHTIEVLTCVCSLLAFAGSLGVFAAQVEAKSWWAQQRAAKESSIGQSGDSRAADVGGKPAGSESKPSPAAVPRPDALTGMADGAGKQEGSRSRPGAAALSRRVALTGIGVSFKLDSRLTKGVYRYMGEAWVSPPLSISAAAQDGTAPAVVAKVQVLDANGQPVDVSPEWIPADPEMVTVSPSQGRDVRITVRHAGQSSLEVISQKVSRRLAIMAWYQGDALQVEISEKP